MLEGITRDSVLQIAADMYEAEEIDVFPVEESLVRTDLYIADEMFMTGSAAELTPVASVDGREVGSGECGEVTAALQKRFFEIVAGDNEDYADWLTEV